MLGFQPKRSSHVHEVSYDQGHLTVTYRRVEAGRTVYRKFTYHNLPISIFREVEREEKMGGSVGSTLDGLLKLHERGRYSKGKLK